MTPTAVALFGLIAWTLLLVIALVTLRSLAVFRNERAANAFSPAGDDVGEFGQRLTRAHANCYEALPAAGLVMLYAIATGQTGATDTLAILFLAARIAQSTTHLISTSNTFVTVRFTFFLLQIAILIWWVLKLSGLL